MRLDVLATGSSANCYLLNAGGQTLILDAGLPVKKMLASVQDLRSVAGCVITHEHGDHVRGVEALVLRGVKTYCSEGTKQALNENGRLTQLNVVCARSTVSAGHFTLMPFETQHDAAEPFGWLIRYEPTGETLIYATDTYYLRYTFPGINYWVVECNYCEDIIDASVDTGELDKALRERLLKSHMSLRRLKDAFSENDLSKTRAIVLVHLSDERSDERRMLREIKEVTGVEEVMAASAGMSIPLELNPF